MWVIPDDPSQSDDENREARGQHQVKVSAHAAAKIRDTCPWAGVTAGDTMELEAVLAVTICPCELDSAWTDKGFVETVPTLPELSRAIQVPWANGFGNDGRTFLTFPAYVAAIMGWRAAQTDAVKQQLVLKGDSVYELLPLAVPASGDLAVHKWIRLVPWGGDTGVIQDDSMGCVPAVELLLGAGLTFSEDDRKMGTRFYKYYSKLKSVMVSGSPSEEETAFTVVVENALAQWPPGLQATNGGAVMSACMDIADRKEWSSVPASADKLLVKKWPILTQLLPTLSAALSGIDARSALGIAKDAAKLLNVSSEDTFNLLVRTEAALKSSKLDVQRSSTQTPQEWASALAQKVESRKREREDAPTSSESVDSASKSSKSGGGGIPKHYLDGLVAMRETDEDYPGRTTRKQSW